MDETSSNSTSHQQPSANFKAANFKPFLLADRWRETKQRRKSPLLSLFSWHSLTQIGTHRRRRPEIEQRKWWLGGGGGEEEAEEEQRQQLGEEATAPPAAAAGVASTSPAACPSSAA